VAPGTLLEEVVMSPSVNVWGKTGHLHSGRTNMWSLL